MREPERVRRGDPTRAEQYQGLWDLLRALGLHVAAPLRLIGSAVGAVLTVDDDAFATGPIWGVTTGVGQAGGTYPWKQQIRQKDHTWKDGPLGSEPKDDGTSAITKDPLYEVNGNTTINVGTYLEIWRAPPSRDYLAQEDVCP